MIISDLHKTREENETLNSKLQKAERTIKELEIVNTSLQDEFKKTKILQDMAQNALEKIKKEHQCLESSLNSVKTENDTLKQRYGYIHMGFVVIKTCLWSVPPPPP